MNKVKTAVFVSGNGSNFENLVNYFKNNEKVDVCLVISDNENAYALKRAKNLSVTSHIIKANDYKDKVSYEKDLLTILEEYKIQLLALAGFFKILSGYFLSNFKGPVINLHPSYLPSYRGFKAVERAFNDKVEYTGVTVHYVDEGVDTGDIIMQEKVYIDKSESLDILYSKIHKLEYQLYPVAITKIVDEILRRYK